MWHAACGKANKVVSICMSLWSLAAMQMIKIITWSGSLYFSLPHTYTLLPPPLPFSIRPFAVFVFCSALQKTSAVATSKWWKWVFFTNKIKSKRCGWQNKKRRVEGDEKGVGENEEWNSNENDAEHGKRQWEWGEWATGGIQTVSARKLHTKSNDVQSYFSQVLCSRHKLQAITLTPPHPPVQLTPAHTRPSPTFLPAPATWAAAAAAVASIWGHVAMWLCGSWLTYG